MARAAMQGVLFGRMDCFWKTWNIRNNYLRFALRFVTRPASGRFGRAVFAGKKHAPNRISVVLSRPALRAGLALCDPFRVIRVCTKPPIFMSDKPKNNSNSIGVSG